MNAITIHADAINREHRMARASAESAVQHAMRCGELLAAKKAELPHGEFQAWIEANCEFTWRTAQRYMAATKCDTHVAFQSLTKLLASGKRRKEPAVNRALTHDSGGAADSPLWAGDDVSWLPRSGETAITGDMHVVWESEFPGYFHYVHLYEDDFGAGGIHGSVRPIAAAAVGFIIRHVAHFDPAKASWEYSDGTEFARSTLELLKPARAAA